jgi:hypothetical protein
MSSYFLRFSAIYAITMIVFLNRYLGQFFHAPNYGNLRTWAETHTAIIAAFCLPMIVFEIAASRLGPKASQFPICIVGLVTEFAIWRLFAMNDLLPTFWPTAPFLTAILWGASYPITLWYRRAGLDRFYRTTRQPYKG